MRHIFHTLPLLGLLFSATMEARADDNGLNDAQIQQIMELLADMRCEVDPDNIEIEDGAIELDDVICGGGQFDFEMNEDLAITGARGE